MRRLGATLFCRWWISSVLLLSRYRGSARGGTRRNCVEIAFVGPHCGANWIDAHAGPFLALDPRNKATAFSSRPLPVKSGVVIVVPPRWLVTLLGPVLARAIWTLGWMIRHKPDVIVGIHLPWNGLLSLCVARLLGARAWYSCVGGAHEFVDGGIHSENVLFEAMGTPSKLLERQLVRIINRFDGVLTTGVQTRASLIALGVTVPVLPVGVGIDLSRFQKMTGGERVFDIVTVARLSPVKRLHILLHSAALLKRQNGKPPTVLIIGAGPELTALQGLAEELGISAAVHFLGWCENVEVWLYKARIFVLASKSEGMPIALLEAMACGLPAVAPGTGDIEDLVQDRQSGFITRTGTAEELAARIHTLLALDNKDYASMAREAVTHASEFGVREASLRWRNALTSWCVTE
jgi:glycosyltransferase involved in cell wall biosynthesis